MSLIERHAASEFLFPLQNHAMQALLGMDVTVKCAKSMQKFFPTAVKNTCGGMSTRSFYWRDGSNAGIMNSTMSSGPAASSFSRCNIIWTIWIILNLKYPKIDLKIESNHLHKIFSYSRIAHFEGEKFNKRIDNEYLQLTRSIHRSTERSYEILCWWMICL